MADRPATNAELRYRIDRIAQSLAIADAVLQDRFCMTWQHHRDTLARELRWTENELAVSLWSDGLGPFPFAEGC